MINFQSNLERLARMKKIVNFQFMCAKKPPFNHLTKKPRCFPGVWRSHDQPAALPGARGPAAMVDTEGEAVYINSFLHNYQVQNSDEI